MSEVVMFGEGGEYMWRAMLWLLVFSVGGLVTGCSDSNAARYENVEWHIADSVKGWQKPKQDEVLVVVKARLRGKWPFGMPNPGGPGYLIDSYSTKLVTSSGEEIRGSYTDAGGPGHAIVIDRLSDVDLPPFVALVPREKANKGGLRLRSSKIPDVELTEATRQRGK